MGGRGGGAPASIPASIWGIHPYIDLSTHPRFHPHIPASIPTFPNPHMHPASIPASPHPSPNPHIHLHGPTTLCPSLHPHILAPIPKYPNPPLHPSPHPHIHLHFPASTPLSIPESPHPSLHPSPRPHIHPHTFTSISTSPHPPQIPTSIPASICPPRRHLVLHILAKTPPKSSSFLPKAAPRGPV